jgi:sugar phosphate permease
MGLTRGQVVTFALTWLTYCLSYFLRKPIAFLKIMLESEFHLSKSDLGWIDVSLLMPYALVQVFGSARFELELEMCYVDLWDITKLP